MARQTQQEQIMPEHHYEADRQWIAQQLGYLNADDREKVCKAYSKVFAQAVSNEPLEQKKTNSGRYAANTRLRIYMAKRFAVFNK